MCVTLWQDFIGATFLASLAAGAGADATAGAAAGEGIRHFSLDLHSAAATSKPSPYLPVCVIATKSPTPSGHEPVETEQGLGEGRVTAWCDRSGRPLAIGQEPIVLHGQNEVRILRRAACCLRLTLCEAFFGKCSGGLQTLQTWPAFVR